MVTIDAIYKEYYPKIHRYLAGMIGAEDAKDLTHDVFIKVNRGLKDFRYDCKLSTWIYRIAKNTALDKIRSKSSQKIVIGLPTFIEKSEEAYEPEDFNIWTQEKALDVEQQIIKNETEQCIREMVENLPPAFKEVLLMSEMEGYKDKEIADMLGTSLNTVKIRLHRARVLLKKRIEIACELFPSDNGDLSCCAK